MAKRKRGRKRGRRRSGGITVRVANEPGRRRRRRARRHNPHRRHRRRRHNPTHARAHGRTHHRRRRRHRRRNPGMGEILGAFGAALAALGTGLLVTYAQAKISPGSPLSLYGFPALAIIGGAALSAKMPKLGTGIAAGGLAGPFTLALVSRALGPGPITAGTRPMGRLTSQADIDARMRARGLGAVSMPRLGAVTAPHLGAVSMPTMGDEADDFAFADLDTGDDWNEADY
jgi:hypothetical protein